jgi:hypothetical protein
MTDERHFLISLHQLFCTIFNFVFSLYWLFSVFSLSELYRLEWQDYWWIMNWNGFGKTQSWPNQGTITPVPWKEWNTRWKLVRTPSILVKIHSEHSLNSNLDHCCYISLVLFWHNLNSCCTLTYCHCLPRRDKENKSKMLKHTVLGNDEWRLLGCYAVWLL